jgi:hypothetical protein
MFNQDDGEATVMASIIGAMAAGSPLAAGVILTSDNVAGATTFVIALMVGLVSIGTGIGKLFSRWKAQIESDLKRDELLCDLVDRITRIEDRQLKIIETIEKQGRP